MVSEKSVIIIGAGPIGIESAHYAIKAGYHVQVLEKNAVGNNIRQWQHIRFFSPFAMNATQLGKSLLLENGSALPEDDRYLTGAEFLNEYLIPLFELPQLQGCIEKGTEVLAISRDRTLKSELIGDKRRANAPFKVLVRDQEGRESFRYAQNLIDASGTYSHPNWLGGGGIPAIGERGLKQKITYQIPRIDSSSLSRYAGKTTAVIGAGHSAATTIRALSEVLETDKETLVLWITRSDSLQPLAEVDNDPLEERAQVVNAANQLSRHVRVTRIANASVESIDQEDNGRLRLTLSVNGNMQEVVADNVVANVGFGPDNSIYRELQVHECYASRGPMKLAASLLADGGGDCLQQTSKGPEVLKNPEPGFFLAGIKSYGRSPNFLLRIGFEQIRDIFQLISGDPDLDLYQHAQQQMQAL